MTKNGEGLQSLFDQVDDILTDSQHPLDVKQSWKVSLALLQQMISFQLEIKREIADLVVKLSEEKVQQDDEIKAVRDEIAVVKTDVVAKITEVKNEVAEIKRTITDYPSITWLLRYKFSNTSKVIVSILAIIYIVYRSYPALAVWWGWPPLP